MSDWGGEERRVSQERLLGIITEKLDTLVDNQKIIKEQVVKTNGRVNKHDEFIIQARVVILILGAIVLPLFLHFVYQWMDKR